MTATKSLFEQKIEQANSRPSPELAAPFYYDAAVIAYEDNNLSKAYQLLTQFVLPYSIHQQLEAFILTIKISNEQNRPLDALKYNSELKRQSLILSPMNTNRITLLRAESLELLQSWPTALKERLKLSLSLPTDQTTENQHRIWQAIQNLTDYEVDYLQNGTDPLLKGWLQITLILRNKETTLEQQNELFSQWQRANPLHPAALNPPEDFRIMANLGNLSPSRIAIVLPMSRSLAPASKAILSGFLQTHYQQPTPRPELQIINSDDYTDINQAMIQASNTEPDIVIGPLRKEDVARLALQPSSLPVIALNQLDHQSAQENIYHFSLTADDEIQTLIHFAIQEGAEQAAILSISDNWALRQSDDFKRLAQKTSLSIQQQIEYENSPAGRQDAIRQLLLINESKQRQDWLKNQLKTTFDTQDRSRQDIDFVFFVGRIDDAKQIRPLLDFYFAESIPMLATSTLNNTAPSSTTKSADIERIYFTDIPAIVTPDKQDTKSNSLKRLQALGADTYSIASKFSLFKHLPNARLSGRTGILTLDDNTNTFRKRPELVQFSRGVLTNVKEDTRQPFSENP